MEYITKKYILAILIIITTISLLINTDENPLIVIIGIFIVFNGAVCFFSGKSLIKFFEE